MRAIAAIPLRPLSPGALSSAARSDQSSVGRAGAKCGRGSDMIRRMRPSVLACLFVIAVNSKISVAQTGEPEHAAGRSHNERLGTVSFANSGSRAAQAPFQRGVALLHSFEYSQA